MKILAIGDVCGSLGCEAVRKWLPALKKEKKIDFTVINGENSADGNGITPESAEMLFACGADVITGGNHSMRRKSAYSMLDENDCVLRPANLAGDAAGKGYCLADLGYTTVAVINLLGRVYLDRVAASNPFIAADELIQKAWADGAKIIIVDFHAEATSEKRAIGFYLDGKISALFGTHTHVQTADSQILKNGTGYITDLGMTGPADSCLGVKTEIIIDRLKNGGAARFEQADGRKMLNGCIFEIDRASGKTVGTERIYIEERN